MNEEEAQAQQNALAEENAKQQYLEGEAAAAVAEAEAAEPEKAYNDGFLEGKKIANTFCEKANEHLKEQINILDAQKASLIKQITKVEARDAQLKEKAAEIDFCFRGLNNFSYKTADEKKRELQRKINELRALLLVEEEAKT